MARRKNTSVFEDLFGIAAALPWWVGFTLAVVSYFVLHRYAVADIAVATKPGQIGQMFTGQMVKTFATLGQYVLPLIFLGGAAASYFGRRKREALLHDAAGHDSVGAIRQMTWQEFELLVGEMFRNRGFAVVEMGGGGADGGVDLRLKKGTETFLVQCKQWRAVKVSVNVVRELYGVMAAQGAAGGFVVTSGEFTADASAFAEGRNIELVGGKALEVMIKNARRTQADPVASVSRTRPAPTVAPQASAKASPACPRCDGTMIIRIAKQGATAGQEFWGCEAFPKCRGVRPVQ